MSSKKKKPGSLWIQCDKCLSIIIERDSSGHENDCPPKTDTITYNFITNNTMVCNINGVKDENSAVNNNNSSLIYLSNIVLQLCGIPVGDNVLITSASGYSLVRKAWKQNDKQQLTASLSEEDIAIENINSNDVFTIQPFKQCLDLAAEIILEGTADNTEDILMRLKHSNCNKIYTVGNIVTLCYYGKRISFKIIRTKALNNYFKGSFVKTSLETLWKIDNGLKINNDFNIHIGGLQAVIQDVNKTISAALKPSENGSMAIPRGIIMYGPSGAGKSLLLNYLSTQWHKLSVNTVSIQCDYNLSTVRKKLDTSISQAKHTSSFIIFIDDLDVICLKKSNEENEIVSILSTFFDKISAFASQIVVIATCNNINSINQSLRRPGRFDKELEMTVPTPSQRFDILNVLLADKTHSVSSDDVKAVSDKTHGYVGADLVSLLFKALSLASCEGCSLSGVHLLQCLAFVKPSAMREIMIQVPDVRWEDIGGQEELKHQLRQAVEWPLKYPDSFKRLGVSPPRGLLMYGPPGCSKTMVAKALATESGLNFISVKGPELFSKWVGESEKAIRQVFRRARQAAPSIVFFDELDALAGERSTSASGNQVQERVLAQLLTELDGVEALGHVIVVGATNRPDRIDPALLRPGRLDRVVYVPLPNAATRLAIFLIRFKKTSPAADVDLDELASLTDGYSGAEICAVCNEAALLALDEDMQAAKVSRKHFISALKIITARTSTSALLLCEQYKNFAIK